MINLKEIAEMTGLSISTVSKVINNKSDDLSQSTIDRVLKIAKEHNYVPYGKIKANNNLKSFNIALIVKNLEKSYRLISSITNRLRYEGYSVLLFDSEDSEEIENSNIKKLLNKNIDGIIYEPVNPNKQNNYEIIKDFKDTITINSFTADSLSIDFKMMAYIATQKLVELGHKNILCIYKKNSWRGKQVKIGYEKCLFDHKINHSLFFELSDNTEDFSRLDIKNFTAVVSSHYSAADILLHKLKSQNFNVPNDYSIIALNNQTNPFTPENEISSLNIPAVEFGKFISDSLLNIVEKREKKLNEFIHPYKININKTVTKPYFLDTSYILIIGSINIDNFIFISEYPNLGSVQFSEKNFKLAGGKALNQAVGLKLMGRRIKILGKVGNDEDSEIIFHTLDKYNIDKTFIKKEITSNTGIAYIPITKTGESSIILSPGANILLKESDIINKKNLFNNVSHTLIQTEIPIATVKAAIKLAKENDTVTILKPAAVKKLDDEIYKNTDILIPNKFEAMTLSRKSTPEEQAQFFIDKGVDKVIITLDSEGAYLKTKNVSKYFHTDRINPIDDTGASDAFISAFLSKLIDTDDLETSITAGNLAAGYCISNFGVSNSLIDKESLDRLMDISKLKNL